MKSYYQSLNENNSITGSLASGKTTASKILSKGNGPLFSADDEVKNFIKKKFKKIILEGFNIKSSRNVKKMIKEKIQENDLSIQKIEKIIHPLVRKEMHRFIKKNSKRKFVFLEIPVLIESKLMNFFDIIFYIKARRGIRLKRFISRGGKKNFFKILDKKQSSDAKKIKYSNHVIVNEKNFRILKKKLLDIFKRYV